MKNQYTSPEIFVVCVADSDVLTASPITTPELDLTL